LAINALRQIRKKMLGVVTVIDRGGGKVLVKNGIKHSSIFTERDFSNQVSKRLKELDISHHKSEK
jgi:orotate phosphoribosyltransferase